MGSSQALNARPDRGHQPPSQARTSRAAAEPVSSSNRALLYNLHHISSTSTSARALLFASMRIHAPGRRARLLIGCITALSLVPSSLGFDLWWPFPKKRFTKNSLLDAGSLGLTGDVRVVAFGDFDGDQL